MAVVGAPLLLLLLLLGTSSGGPLAATTGDDNIPESLADSSNELEREQRSIPTSCGCKATLYEHPQYGGRSLEVFGQNSNLEYEFFSDKASAAKIEGTCCWIFYEHWFSGDVQVLRPGLYESPYRWGGAHDQLTSLRALPPQGSTAIALFEHHHFGGRMVVLSHSNTDLIPLEFDNYASSAIVIGGSWRICEHGYYTGYCRDIGPGHYSSIPIGDNVVSSVRRN